MFDYPMVVDMTTSYTTETAEEVMTMEGNGRRLAWIAIALSAVALVVSLGGRAQSRWMGYPGQQGTYGPPATYGQQGQTGPQQFGPQGQQQFGPQGQQQFGPQGRRGMGRDQGFAGGPDQRGMFGGRPHFGPGAFFFLPFLLLGKLIKLAFVVLLVWLGLRLISGRGFGRPWGRGPWGRGPEEHGGPDQPNRPGPEQPPYTGDTQQM